ncbi:MAG: hypothetical protein LBN38_05660 [Verrucomicrobiota bacterium]|jgi:hypothetical protein|nr:hypothetical protein [Verrucomicrobiota bacterium]
MPHKPHHKVQSSLKYRWGMIGVIVAIGFCAWYFTTSGEERARNLKSDATRNLVKEDCVRCGNDPEKKKTCTRCNGTGQIWMPYEQSSAAQHAP